MVGMKLDVITPGEALVLFAAQQPGPLEGAETFTRMTAGAELNVAIGLARLGLRVGYVGRLGDDVFGRTIWAAMEREGIDRRHVTFDSERPTGFMLKSRRTDGGDPQIEYFRRASAASHIERVDNPAAFCRGCRHLHLTGVYVAVSPSTRRFVFELAAAARAEGLSVSFDPNLRPQLWASRDEMVECLNHLATHADWVFPGLEEGRLLTGEHTPQGIADFYLERGARAVVVKLGADGAYFASAGERGHAAGAPVARVVDTVGAGDGFAVGVVSALLEGLTLAAAAARGNAIGARVVQFPGDADGLPTRSQLDALSS
jgi:2-dehydro-3-deoxygluconokinase